MLDVGTRLGPHEILGPLGSGGMGEVYRARDTRLDRTVAIKVLPEHLSERADSRERFEREAKAIAALNDPHICVLYDTGVQDGALYLVMEYLEGETLAERLKRGPIPLPQALEYAIQIAGALDKAHRQGITHRDLKPGNIMLAKSGVKLLDFGLAKLAAEAGAGPGMRGGMSAMPTAQSGLTADGTIVGTLQYMSPEQLEGQEADARTDIFAFGAVLYEMITGKRAFEGKSQPSLIASIMSQNPPSISSIQKLTPPALDRIVAACIAKDKDDRFQTARDLLRELKWIADPSYSETAASEKHEITVRRGERERVAWAVALAIFVLSTIVLAIPAYRYWTPKEVRTVRFDLSLPPDTQSLSGSAAPYPVVSPDGRHVAFIVISKGANLLFVRALDSLNAQSYPGTEGILPMPFWSHDSRYIGFVANGKLKKVSVSGGPPQVLSDAQDNQSFGFAGSWNREDVILFESNRMIYKVSAAGGVSSVLLSPDSAHQETAVRFPAFLPDGIHFLYFALSPVDGKSEIRAASLNGGPAKPIVHAGSLFRYVDPGYLLFVVGNTLMAQPFDAANLSLSHEMVPVAQGIPLNAATGGSPFSVSDNGTLVYRSGASAVLRLTWYDRAGKQVSSEPLDGDGRQPSLSPDGNQLAYTRLDNGLGDIWVRDLIRGTNTRLTFDTHDQFPVWSPDGTKIGFESNRTGKYELYQKPSNGAGGDEPLRQEVYAPYGWSANGIILFQGDSLSTEVWALPMSGNGKAYSVLKDKFTKQFASLSPDGKFIAYASNESGRYEIYVQTFPPGGGRWQVSVQGGAFPMWRSDGKELFFYGSDLTKLMSADTKLGATFEAGVPKQLFQLPAPATGKFAVTRDGQHFVFALPRDSSGAAPMTIVLNWTADLKK